MKKYCHFKVISLITALLCFFSVLPVAEASLAVNPAPPVGLKAALERAEAFNRNLDGKTAKEISEEAGIDLWAVLSPYGTETPPDPLITVSPEDTWEDIVGRLLDKYEVSEDSVGIGYWSSLTGEEHYIRGGEYMVSASMFKVPTCMIYADKVSSGEMIMEDEIYGYPYSYLQYRAIVHSDNEQWMNLVNNLGGYMTFKQLQIPYLGNNPAEELGWTYNVDNYYTAQEFIFLLKMLYENPERFPGVTECMLEAEPYSYFRQYEHRYPIAQKYGFINQNESTGAHTYINTCGIVYTDDPFCIVMFTDNVVKAYDLLGEYSRVMCDYTNLLRQKKEAAEEAARLEEERLLQEQIAAIMATPEPVPEITPAEVPAADTPEIPGSLLEQLLSRYNMSVVSSIFLLWIFIAMIVCFVLIFRRNMSGRINGFWAVISILLAACGFVACIVGYTFGTVYAKPNGNPAEVVDACFIALQEGRYDDACSYLSDYSSLGLENIPANEESRMLLDALKKSYLYSRTGGCEINLLHAKQKVSFRFLNLAAVEKDASSRINRLLNEIVQTRPASQVYDAEGNYLRAVTDEVYRKALSQAVENAGKYYTSAQFDVELDYENGRWLITTDPRLITALTGGAA